jgi:cytochrome c biogenesis protein CcdA/thiol-disulfide isomerase/thioredoxin
MHEAFLQYSLAFFEGIGLVFSPCILPILPLILAGGATGDKRKPFGIIVGFVLSFTLFSLLSRQIFSIFGIAQDTLQTASFALLALLGVVMLVPVLEEGVARLTQGLASKAQSIKSGEGFSGGVVMGFLIGLVWTPCAGPILAAALLQVIQSKSNLEAALTIFLFSLGAAIPMFVIALSGKALAQKFGRHTTRIRRTMGLVLVIFAGFGLFGFNIGAIAPNKSGQDQASTAKPGEIESGLAQTYPAPEIAGITHWINTQPLKMSDLKGRVVLVDFWTYSCINCLRTLPYLRTWYSKYHDQGFEIIGVHAPEFAFESKTENVEAAVKKYGIAWPVAMDNNYGTWHNYQNRYWPAHYLIDREGRVVYTHFGEGHYDVTEHNIRALLGLEKQTNLSAGPTVTIPGQTPETYLGNKRKENEWTGDSQALSLHHWQLSGNWQRTDEMIESGATGDTLTLHFHAQKVFLVMTSKDKTPLEAEVFVDQPANKAADLQDGYVKVTESRLYELVNIPKAADGTIRIKAPGAGLQAYAFTFETGVP